MDDNSLRVNDTVQLDINQAPEDIVCFRAVQHDRQIMPDQPDALNQTLGQLQGGHCFRFHE